jgi:hypothetical protein
MIGVSNPTSDLAMGDANPSTPQSLRLWAGFTSGYALGSAISSLAVLALTSLIFHLAHVTTPLVIRKIALCSFLAFLSLQDLRSRTLCRHRQTPQRLSRILPSRQLGFVYGLDVGSLVSTYKTTSLQAGVLATCALVEGSSTAHAVVIMWLTGASSLVLRHSRRAMSALRSFDFIDKATLVAR